MNKRDTDLLDMLPALEDGSLMYTPISICRDMVNLIPDDVFNKDAKFLDIACKSGRFLREIMYRLMESNQMQSGSAEGRDKKKYNLAIESERKEYIMREQLFGLSLNDTVVNIARRNLYGTLDSSIDNIITVKEYPEIAHKPKYVMGDTNIYKILEEKFNIMADEKKGMFDVVIGNPPYNKGIDLDFIDLGYKLSKKYTVMITPAKWQTAKTVRKMASKNINYEQFRPEYVKRMKYVCFYPDCLDVFGISQADGISYFMIDKNSTYENNCTVENKCNLQKLLNSTAVRDITHQQSLWNIGNEIVECLGDYKKYSIEEVIDKKDYTININKQLRQSLSGAWDWNNSCIDKKYIGHGGYLFNQKEYNIGVIDKIRCLKKDEESTSGTSTNVFTSDSIDECKSFYTWITSKFTRFFILINISSLTIINDNTFRFVPAPPSGKFDHIYTDEELYKAFNLPQKYIDVIESVIKERK